MILLTNFASSHNHLARLSDLAASSDELLVVSPFLARAPDRLLRRLEAPALKRLRLITAASTELRQQASTIASLNALRLYFAGAGTGVEFSVAIAERLHGKVYVFFKNATPSAAILSSANFTERGLTTNFEWGLEINDPRTLSEITASLRKLPVRELSHRKIEELQSKLATLSFPVPPRSEIDLFHEALVSAEEHATDATIWLKPSGVSENPVRPGDLRYAELNVRLNFSKVRPSGVSIGDHMVVYGVGARQLMGLFEITGAPKYATDEEQERFEWAERWPWHVEARNLAPVYSSQWWEHGLDIGRLQEQFRRNHPSAPLTATGGTSLGALNYGSDKLRLSNSFGSFLRRQIASIEEAL